MSVNIDTDLVIGEEPTGIDCGTSSVTFEYLDEDGAYTTALNSNYMKVQNFALLLEAD